MSGTLRWPSGCFGVFYCIDQWTRDLILGYWRWRYRNMNSKQRERLGRLMYLGMEGRGTHSVEHALLEHIS